MFKKKIFEKILLKNILNLNYLLSRDKIVELADLLGNPKKLLFRNFISGISKGFGFGIGFTIITAITLIILQKIVTLNIPIIGQYIYDIIEIVERNH